MPLIYLVRHGRVDLSRPDPADPQLDTVGLQQADAVARRLAAQLSRPLPIVSSPLRRCVQTAAPLASLWNARPGIDERISELPTPPALGADRRRWLTQVVQMSWPQLAAHSETLSPGYTAVLAQWHAGLHAALAACRADTVLFSHFAVINALAAGEQLDGPVSRIELANASITVFEASAGGVQLRHTESATGMPPA